MTKLTKEQRQKRKEYDKKRDSKLPYIVYIHEIDGEQYVGSCRMYRTAQDPAKFALKKRIEFAEKSAYGKCGLRRGKSPIYHAIRNFGKGWSKNSMVLESYLTRKEARIWEAYYIGFYNTYKDGLNERMPIV